MQGISQEQQMTMKEFAHLVGKILTFVELSTTGILPSEQQEILKGKCEREIYNTRNEILQYVKSEENGYKNNG